MKFKEQALSHLSKVKSADILEYSEIDNISKGKEGKFRDKSYSHIFHDDMCKWKHNGRFYTRYTYLPKFRDKIIDYLAKHKQIKLHNGQKHLNSSQSVVINFLVPVIDTPYEQDFCKAVFGIKGLLQIEKKMLDGFTKATEIDFAIEEDNKLHLYEAKYTEDDFSSVSIKKKTKEYDIGKYVHKWNGSYKEKGKLVPVEYRKVLKQIENVDIHRYDNFNNIININKWKENNRNITYFDNYQLIRNLYNTFYTVKKNIVVERKNIGSMNVVIPKEHEKLAAEFNEFRQYIKEETKDYVQLQYWEDLCEKAINYFDSVNYSGEKQEYIEHYKLFQYMYLKVQ